MNLPASTYRLVRKLSWEEVFQRWEEQEARNPNWTALYKQRGFTSWRQWRQTYAEPLQLTDRSWALYEVRNPEKIVPSWLGGPFRSWIQVHYGGKKKMTFAELAQSSELQQHPAIKRLMSDYPRDTFLIGVIQDEDVVIIEGMHRCCAIAIAALRGKSITGAVTIALADSSNEDLPRIGQRQKGNR